MLQPGNNLQRSESNHTGEHCRNRRDHSRGGQIRTGSQYQYGAKTPVAYEAEQFAKGKPRLPRRTGE